MQSERILHFLPELYRSAGALEPGTPLSALLEIMANLHAPVEGLLKDLRDYVDPYRAPPRFVHMLAAWLGLDHYQHIQGARRGSGRPHYAAGVGRLRLLVVEAGDLYRGRGTTASLQRFLEIATGLTGFNIEEAPKGPDGQPMAFHMRIVAPSARGAMAELIQRIVEQERPACVTFELIFEESTEKQETKVKEDG